MGLIKLVSIPFFFTIGSGVLAQNNVVEIKIIGDQRCISSNGFPNHNIGQFPNQRNPNHFRSQDVSVCVDASPSITGRIDRRASGSGITVSGIILRPKTADWYDASSSRGFSKNRSSGWNLEGMEPKNRLGLDLENAHVDNRGLYHYHGISSSLVSSLDGTLLGYAADGHEIHYVGEKAKASWQLKNGMRSTPPFGRFDGTYNQDYHYVAGSGNLDECNGNQIKEQYRYYATNTYPFFPRCFLGRVSKDFKRRQ